MFYRSYRPSVFGSSYPIMSLSPDSHIQTSTINKTEYSNLGFGVDTPVDDFIDDSVIVSRGLEVNTGKSFKLNHEGGVSVGIAGIGERDFEQSENGGIVDGANLIYGTEVDSANFDDGLWLDVCAPLSSGTLSNFFIEKNDKDSSSEFLENYQYAKNNNNLFTYEDIEFSNYSVVGRQ